MKLLLIILIANFKPLYKGKYGELLFDYSTRIARVIREQDTVDFYIRSDHTTPFKGYLMDRKIVLIALKVDTSSKDIFLNPGWWIQVYNINGIYDTSFLYTPKEVLKKGYGLIKPISTIFRDTLFITFNISNCVFSFYPSRLENIKCGFLPNIPVAKKRYAYIPEKYPDNAPQVKKFLIKNDKLFLEVYNGKETKLVRIR